MTGEINFGSWLYQARKNYRRNDGKRGGLSQKELAAMLSVDNSYIGKLERGDGEPSRELLAKIANRFNVSFDLLLKYAGKEPEPKIDSVSFEALQLFDLVRRIPKRNLPTATKILESLANGDDDETNAQSPGTNPPSNIYDSSKRQNKKGA